MMMYLKNLEDEVAAWEHISVHPHRFGGREFRLRTAEVGHTHNDGIVDIPFPRLLRDALLTEGLAEEHRWVPNSGWVTFHVRNEEDLKQTRWLMRMSYLRYVVKTTADPRKLLDEESVKLRLNPQFKTLLKQFVPIAARCAVNEAAQHLDASPFCFVVAEPENRTSTGHDSAGLCSECRHMRLMSSDRGSTFYFCKRSAT